MMESTITLESFQKHWLIYSSTLLPNILSLIILHISTIMLNILLVVLPSLRVLLIMIIVVIIIMDVSFLLIKSEIIVQIFQLNDVFPFIVINHSRVSKSSFSVFLIKSPHHILEVGLFLIRFIFFYWSVIPPSI